ncbi:MAG: hypothetical protein ABI024_05370 [Vicinamibacterales bacterium]
MATASCESREKLVVDQPERAAFVRAHDLRAARVVCRVQVFVRKGLVDFLDMPIRIDNADQPIHNAAHGPLARGWRDWRLDFADGSKTAQYYSAASKPIAGNRALKSNMSCQHRKRELGH